MASPRLLPATVTKMHSTSTPAASRKNILLQFVLVIDTRMHNAEHVVTVNVGLQSHCMD